MGSTQFSERFDMAAKGLCPRLRTAVTGLPESIKEQAQEIRIRTGRPLAVYCTNRMYYLTAQSKPVTALCGNGMLIVTPKDVSDTFQSICGYSVYSHQNEIRHGFLTMQGGHRAGLCGTAVYQNGTLSNIRDISSINIRIARQIGGAADKLLELMHEDFGGLLLCGAPSCGKTTILRDLSRQLSNTYMKKVAVVDERGELAGTCSGLYQNDLGQSDILDGYSKGEGILQAVRCLSPEIIICDEAGTIDDVRAIEQGLNAGVSMIASIHAATRAELLSRVQGRRLLQTGAFQHVAFLKGRQQPGEIREYIETEALSHAADTLGSGHHHFRSVNRAVGVTAHNHAGLFF